MPDTASERIRVLCVADRDEAGETAAILERETDRFDVTTAAGVEAGLARLDGATDCIVSGYDLSDGTGLDLLRAVRKRSPDLPFIFFTDMGSEAVASEAISAGVTDYLRRDDEMDRHPILVNRIWTAVGHDRNRREREARQAELRRSERRLEAVFEDPKMLVGVLSPDGRLRKANRTAMEFVDADHEDLVGRPFHETPWWSDDLREDVQRWIERAAAGEYVEYEADHKHGDDEIRSVSGTIRPVTDEAGEVVSLIASARDITERRTNERELQQRNDRLNDVASIVSHDLRSPLNVASGHLAIARSGDDDHLSEVAHALDRMEELVDDLLTLAHEGERVSEIETVDLAAMVRDCWRNVSTTETAPQVDTDLVIRADPDQLRHLLENLLGNALRHGGADVAVTIGDLDGGFYVADDGPGIPEADREAVFDSGYSTAAEGTGVGLSIVQRIVEAHGWEVAVTESETGGTRFEITGIECESCTPTPN
ncbi:ATP-binding protein [Haloplanus aerogenes]|uniref:histidine kinase n=1 Tax=Haloplanus aerogenes TaxID=660522 RepID=A0A3M0EAC3_9EURY|nr:ATP-binding protein [Haloplanus aerogenes]AZH25403.1 PAS domain S-box protein [Haloplanus aerogenes]RMB25110.1 PAS domain S-box-containing protein [Haloplanus aerogenes]